MRVIDGNHRLRAAILRGSDNIQVRFFDGPDEDAFLLAVRLNTGHGLPLSRADRLAAAAKIMNWHPDWSNRLIAELSGISDKSVAKLRCSTPEVPQLHTRTGCDGRTRPLSAAEGRKRAAALLAERPDASLRDMAGEAGISIGTARDVKDRVRRGVSPVPGNSRSGGESAQPSEPGPKDHAARKPLRLHGRKRVLVTLRQDPSLRLTDVGRLFLRLALAHPSDAGTWDRLADGLPSHCLDRVLQLSRSHAEAWLHFVEAVERRRRRAD